MCGIYSSHKRVMTSVSNDACITRFDHIAGHLKSMLAKVLVRLDTAVSAF